MNIEDMIAEDVVIQLISDKRETICHTPYCIESSKVPVLNQNLE